MLFADIIGQENIKKRLIQTVQDNRVSHAQLFLGPEGSGKLALAVAYAQYVNCENKQNEDSCGTCASCLKYDKLIHPDLHFVYPVANTKKAPSKAKSKDYLDDWRELLLEKKYYISLGDWYEKIEIENKQGIINTFDCNEIIKTLGYKSFESEYKVMIIWMVEKLYHAAAPKILKILEEPPDKTLFILVSEQQDKIINTIISRTQIVKIPRLTDQEIFDALKTGFDSHSMEAQRIVNLVRGNFREAVRKETTQQDSDDYLKSFTQWMRLCFQRNISGIQQFIEQMAKSGREKQKGFLQYAIQFIRECVLIQYSNNQLVRLNPGELEFAGNFASFIHSKNISEITEELNNAIFHIERNANPSILFMDLSLKINKLLKIKAT